MATGSTFSVGGLISGLQTQDVVAQLMALEQRPLNLLKQQQSDAAARTQAVDGLKTQILALQSAVAGLASRATINAKVATTDTPSGSPTVLTASAKAGAANGSFRVTVSRLATATTVSGGSAMSADLLSSAKLAEAGLRYTPVYGTLTVNGQNVDVTETDTVDSLVAKLDALSDVSASLVQDANGRTIVKLQSSSQIKLGSLGDTSNALRLLNLAGAVETVDGNGVHTVQSTVSLATTDTGASLAQSRVPGLNAVDGGMKINGVSIRYKANESISTILNRINSSGAKVTASYDSFQDRITLTGATTGPRTIALEDTDGGNFLAATGLLAASQTLGQTAEFSINTVNGGQTLTSDSNTVTDYVPGVTLNLKSPSNSPVTVTIGQDTATTISAVQSFVQQFNSVLDTIASDTKYDPGTKTASVLTGDVGVQDMTRQLRSLVSSAAYGIAGSYTTLASVGISTGAVGSTVGTTDHLVLDQSKLSAALTDNPQAVEALFTAFAATLGLPTGSVVTGVTGTPLSQHVEGTYHVKVLDASNNVEVTFVTADGRQVMKQTGTLTPGQENTSLIPGLKLTPGASLVVGAESTFTMSVTARGTGVQLADYLTGLLGNQGFFVTRADAAQRSARDLTTQIDTMQRRLDQKEAQLNRRFAALESALARIQNQSSGALTTLAQLSTASNNK